MLTSPGEDGRGGAAVLVDVELLGADEGGRRSPVVDGYRPQLDLGQRFASGDRSQWDSQWRFSGELAPGARARVQVELFGLPVAALLPDHRVEFFEGSRLVARGVVHEVPGRRR